MTTVYCLLKVYLLLDGLEYYPSDRDSKCFTNFSKSDWNVSKCKTP